MNICWIFGVNLLRYNHKSFLTSNPNMLLYFGQSRRFEKNPFHWLIASNVSCWHRLVAYSYNLLEYLQRVHVPQFRKTRCILKIPEIKKIIYLFIVVPIIINRKTISVCIISVAFYFFTKYALNWMHFKYSVYKIPIFISLR